MFTVLEVTLPVFGLVFCGYAGAARRMLPERAVDGINAFVFWFALPAMLFRVVALRPLGDLIAPRFMTCYLIAGLAVFLITLWMGRAGLIDPRQRGAAQASAWALTGTHGNVGYLGLALVGELNRDGQPIVALTIICDIFVFITLAIALLEVQTGGGGRGIAPVVRTVISGLRRSPLVTSIPAGLLFSMSGLPLPAVADNFTRLLANAAGPCALFAIGAALGGQKIAMDRPVLVLSAIKLLLHPALAAAMLMVLLPVEPTMAAVGVLCATLPSASNTFIISQRYGLDTRAISASILGGTFVGLLTVSTAIWLLGLRP
jgi:malonate transporter